MYTPDIRIVGTIDFTEYNSYLLRKLSNKNEFVRQILNKLFLPPIEFYLYNDL